MIRSLSADEILEALASAENNTRVETGIKNTAPPTVHEDDRELEPEDPKPEETEPVEGSPGQPGEDEKDLEPEEAMGTPEKPLTEDEQNVFYKMLVGLVFPKGAPKEDEGEPQPKVYREWDYFFPEIGELQDEALVFQHKEAATYRNNLVHIAYSIILRYGAPAVCISKIKIRATEVGGKFFTVRMRRAKTKKHNSLTLWMFNEEHKAFIKTFKYEFPIEVTVTDDPKQKLQAIPKYRELPAPKKVSA